MKARIVTDSLARTFRLLRNRVEAELHAPAVVLVTSATARDGASLTAYGLAESLSHTHQRTALVTASAPAKDPLEWSTPAPAQPRRRASDRLGGADTSSGSMSIVTISQERLATISRSSVAALVTELRGVHDYVVIDGGDLANNGFALLLASSADAILVSFLAGRQQTPSDRDMLDAIERSETKVLGVVMTDQESIDQFNVDEAQTERVVIPAPKSVNPIAARLEVALHRIGKAL